MQKIDFVNSQQPAINDTNLNLMQTYIETAIQGAVSGDTLPVGAIMPFSGYVPPDNYLLCNGDAVSRTTYAQLFSIVGTKFGAGDGSTTFNLPDLRGKVPVGYDVNQTEFQLMGTTGGEKTVTLTVNQIPSHYHTQSLVGGSGGNPGNKAAFSWSQPTNQYDYSGTDLAQRTGGGQAHNNLQPYQTVNYIIKAFQTAGTVASIVNADSSSATNAYSCSYANTLLSQKCETYIYSLTAASGALNTGGWRDMANNYTTPTIPSGTYLVLAHATVNSSQAGIGLATIRTMIDGGEAPRTSRQSIPTGAATMTATTSSVVTFNSDSTHTLNVQIYPLSYNLSGASAVTIEFIRLQ